MRLEHEINEVIRKQKEFYELKKQYFEKKKGVNLEENEENSKKMLFEKRKNMLKAKMPKFN